MEKARTTGLAKEPDLDCVYRLDDVRLPRSTGPDHCGHGTANNRL